MVGLELETIALMTINGTPAERTNRKRLETAGIVK
jgi:hypothetical protein